MRQWSRGGGICGSDGAANHRLGPQTTQLKNARRNGEQNNDVWNHFAGISNDDDQDLNIHQVRCTFMLRDRPTSGQWFGTHIEDRSTKRMPPAPCVSCLTRFRCVRSINSTSPLNNIFFTVELFGRPPHLIKYVYISLLFHLFMSCTFFTNVFWPRPVASIGSSYDSGSAHCLCYVHCINLPIVFLFSPSYLF
jgi:hypothetical protein